MKKSAILMGVTAFVLLSCDSTRVVTTTDDVYASPSEARQKARLAAEQEAKAKQEALARENAAAQQRAAEEAALAAAKQAEIDNNPYYQEPQYNSEEYYDYEYSSRINRFHNPIGVGYYDNFYTNMYTYTGNPMMYGNSIYSSYGWGMPSAQFGMMSFGMSSGWGYGGMMYGGNAPFHNPFYSPWCSFNCFGGGMGYGGGWGYGGMGMGMGYGGWGYNNYNMGYMMGYNQGFNNGFYSGMYGGGGYYNRFDVNSRYSSVSTGPRNSNLGGTRQRSDGASGGVRQKYNQAVANEQQSSARFTESGRAMRNQSTGGENSARPGVNNSGVRSGSNEQPNNARQPNIGRDVGQPSNSSGRGARNQGTQPGRSTGGQSSPARNSGNQTSPSSTPRNQSTSPSRNSGRSSEYSAPSRSSGGSFSSPSRGSSGGGGGSSPRNSGGGGRPR